MPNTPHDDEAAGKPPAPRKSAKPSKSGTTALFPRAREQRRDALTHEQIEEDLAAFERAGGRIQVLGNTLTFKHLVSAVPPPAHSPAADTDTQSKADDADAS